MTELETLMNYLTLTIMLFFITFFLDIFYQYIRYKMITPRKMLSHKKGGIFEHYKIVGGLILALLLTHGIFDISPFSESVLAFAIDLTLNYIFITIFLTFFLVFLFFLAVYTFAKIKKVEDLTQFMNKKTVPIINTAMILAVLIAAALLIILLLNVPIE